MRDEPQRPVRSRSLVWMAAAFALGVWLSPRVTSGWIGWALLGGSLLTALLCRAVRARVIVPGCTLLLALGLLLCQAALQTPEVITGSHELTGTVCGEARARTEHRVTFWLTDVTVDGAVQAGKGYCTCYVYGDDELPRLFDGAHVRFRGTVYVPSGVSGEHDFDFSLWLRQNGGAFGITSVTDLTVENTPQTAPVVDLGARLRAGMKRALYGAMGEESRVAAALLLGDKDGLREDELAAFRDSGVAHVMAVSGLHVGILAMALMGLMGALRVPKRVRLLILTAFLAVYAAITGFSAATVRAGVMMLLAAVAKQEGRRVDPLLMLSAALLIVLAINPLQLFSAGLVLSFSAVAGILLLDRPLRQVLRADSPARTLLGRIWRGTVSLLCVSAAAQAGVLLPTAAYFHQLPLYGLLVNLLIVPLVGILVPAYAVTLLLSPVPYLGAALGWVAARASGGLLWLVGLLSRLPYATVRVGTPTVAAIALGVAAILLCSRYIRAGVLRRTVALLLCATVTAVGAYITRPADLRYIQLSVGQEDAALLLTKDETIAIDVGSFGSRTADLLLAENRDIDVLILTHLHLDHAGGVAGLLEEGVRVKRVYLPQSAADARLSDDSLVILDTLSQAGIPVVELAAGDELRYSRGAIRVLWPESGKTHRGKDANENCMALSVTMDDITLLNMSDLTGDYEGYVNVPPCDILKVAHHGSAESTGERFILGCMPQAALISCGPFSKTLPSDATIRRLQDAGASVYRTDGSGDITIAVKGNSFTLSTFLGRDGR